MTDDNGMRLSVRVSGSLSMPMMAISSGTANPAVMQACSRWRARASVTAMMPMGLGKPRSHSINRLIA